MNHSMSIMNLDAVGEGSVLDNTTVSFGLGAYPLSLLGEPELRMILHEDSHEVTILPPV